MAEKIQTEVLSNPQIKARFLVKEHYNAKKNEGEQDIQLQDVKLQTFNKIGQNWRATLTVNRPRTKYYEVTHKGDVGTILLDVYMKIDSVLIPSDMV